MLYSITYVCITGMGLVVGWVAALYWDGYQCGYCGAEFKTRSELMQHQVNRQAVRQAGRQADRQADRQAVTQTESLTGRQAGASSCSIR